MPYADRTTLNNLTPNLDIGDVADPALRLAFFQYLTNLMDANYAEQQALITSGTLSPVPPDSLYRQALINAGLEVSQELGPLGTATVATATSRYIVDGVKCYNNGSGANATSSQVAVSDLDGTGYGVRVVHAATPATGGKLALGVTVEARDAYKLAGQQAVFALKVKGVAGMDKLTINARYKTSDSAIASTDTLVLSTGAITINSLSWQTIPLVVTLPTRATLTTSGVIGFEIVGSKSTAEASGDGFIVAELELIRYGSDIGFNPKAYDEELLRCLRFYERIGTGATGVFYNAGAILLQWRYMVDKRIVPIITLLTTTPAITANAAYLSGSGSSIISVHLAATKSGGGVTIGGFSGRTAGEFVSVNQDALIAADSRL